jgi:hypothetical protein
MKGLFKKFPLHVFFVGFFPLTSLFFYNASQIPFFAGSRAYLFSTVIVLLTYLLSLILLRNVIKAGILSTYGLSVFFSYGHIYDFLTQHARPLAHLSLLLAVCLAGLLALLVALWRSKSTLEEVNLILNSMSFALVAMLLFNAGLMMANGKWFSIITTPAEHKTAPVSNAALDKPDVYYILVDSYARQDVLEDKYHFDNGDFINQLKKRGFAVPPCSQSNYDNTASSLSSSLNMDYLDALGVDLSPQSDSFIASTNQLIAKNKVRSIFKEQGYLTYAFATKALFVNLNDSDYFYDVNRSAPAINRVETMNFYEMFLNTTIVRVFWKTRLHQVLDTLPLSILPWFDPQADVFSTTRYLEYQQNVYALKKLMEIPTQPGAKFVYAHLMVTHSSFVFNPDGSFMVDTDETDAAYARQVAYANGQLLKIVDQIISQSKVPPIIIIQGDHNREGGKPEKVRILNAYYLPDGGSKNLPADISPVNSFRWVFNHYFNGQYELLENRSYYRAPDNVLTPVGGSCIAGAQ